jgi:PAS domain S-box-containing protein
MQLIDKIKSFTTRIMHPVAATRMSRQIGLVPETFLDVIPDPLLVLDGDLRVITANPAFYHVFRTRPGEVQGRLLCELGDGQWDIPEFRELLESISVQGKAVDNFKVAKYFPAIGERTMRLYARGIPGQDRGTERLFLYIQETADSREADEKLKLAAYEWRRTFDSITDSVFLIDKESRFTRANRALFDSLHTTPQELLGKKCYEFLHKKDRQPWPTCPFQLLLKDQKQHTEEVEDFEGRPLLVTVSPIFDEKQQIVGAVHVAKDISRYKKALEELKSACKKLQSAQKQLIHSEKLAAIGQLSTGVAHEINNPIGFISNNLEVMGGYVEVLTRMGDFAAELKGAVERRAWEDAEAVRQRMEKYEEEAQYKFIMGDLLNLVNQSLGGVARILKIVMDLRTFAREGTETEETTNIEGVIDGILGIVHNELKYRAELKKSYGTTPPVRCQVQKMGQVFVNLLVNAGQAIKERGVVEIRTYEKDRYVCVDISDTGSGIPQENLQKIFEPFFTTKPAGQGTGLGLAISYDIVKKHGGDMRVVSEVGKGTTFTVMLPIG